MSGFVTYAQNFEDLMIWRAVRDVAEGFYIDAGAADPDEDSVTRAFYDRGWRGVNIEPNPNHFAALSAARPRDTNLSCLLGAAPGDTKLYSIADTGLSTVKRDLARRHAAGGYEADDIIVPVRTLADICSAFAPADIHFLKIDVEGAEADVLAGADFAKYRPWIVLLEATEPMSQVENWAAWEPMLTAAAYGFVWFDGLNRFYVAAEHRPRLAHAFQTPPNVFDGWIKPRGQQDMLLLKRAAAAEAAIGRVREETDRARAALDVEAAAARSEAHAARAEAAALRAPLAVSQQAIAGLSSDVTNLRAAEAKARQDAHWAGTELAAERMALKAATRDAVAARAEAGRLRAVFATARREGAATRADNAQLRMTAAALRAEANGAHLEIQRLSGVEHALGEARALIAALYSSASWRFSAPLRGLSRGLRFFGLGRARLRRLRQVATLGRHAAGLAGLLRIAIYGIGRIGARLPGARLIRHVLPGPYAWFQRRYLVYFNAADALSDTGQPAMAHDAGQYITATSAHDVSYEEQLMQLRLLAQGRGA